jgi:hypothetical protein
MQTKTAAYRKILRMSSTHNRYKTEELRTKLHDLDAEFEREMRARGFDPAQAENIALPSGLAKLYAEREQLRALIEEYGDHES